MGYYQAGDRGGWETGNYYAAGDPGFFSSIWSGIKSVGRVIAPIAATVAPIVGAIGAPFTGGLSLGLGAAIGAGARLLGNALDDPTPVGSPLDNIATAEQPPVSIGYRTPQPYTPVATPQPLYAGPSWGAISPFGVASSVPMRSAPPRFGQDYSDYSTDYDYDVEEEEVY